MNLTVPLLWALAASLLTSALRREEEASQPLEQRDRPPAPLAQAA